MPPHADPLFFHPDHEAKGDGEAFFGERCALVLAMLLLALLSLTTAMRWRTTGSSLRVEQIIQQPVAPETATFSSQNPDLTAPDPGDAPP